MAVPIWPKLFALCDIGTSDRTGSVWAVGDGASCVWNTMWNSTEAIVSTGNSDHSPFSRQAANFKFKHSISYLHASD
jgi:hypothetical protein